MVGSGEPHAKKLGQGPEELLGLTEREGEDHADRPRSLDGQIRVDPLASPGLPVAGARQASGTVTESQTVRGPRLLNPVS